MVARLAGKDLVIDLDAQDPMRTSIPLRVAMSVLFAVTITRTLRQMTGFQDHPGCIHVREYDRIAI